jgi:hypothetical protein
MISDGQWRCAERLPAIEIGPAATLPLTSQIWFLLQPKLVLIFHPPADWRRRVSCLSPQTAFTVFVMTKWKIYWIEPELMPPAKMQPLGRCTSLVAGFTWIVTHTCAHQPGRGLTSLIQIGCIPQCQATRYHKALKCLLIVCDYICIFFACLHCWVVTIFWEVWLKYFV